MNWPPCEHEHCRHLAARLDAILERLDKQMAAVDDLNAAVTALGTEVTTFLADLAASISGGVTADQAEAVVASINGFTAQLQAADPAVTPAPPAS